ncbi:MAG TPA: MFS transporter [Methylophaga aminisulfidivorans]|uniref:MFS transporter n=1 Tax=Methylophaga TaxID=40222 RepID=UPI00176A8015|nr:MULTISPECIES: MFS transporter [Methylophaga]HIC47181.1 MFS transporter [Methylophaga sp.]HIM40170.1 MFS transporter [Methylophaga aminisulfidivorans]
MSNRSILPVVLSCHFLAAFTVLGMPLYLPQILSEFSLSQDSIWIGILFSLPTIMTALSAPWWGKFADHIGRKLSLLRALIGLTVAFVLAGVSSSMWLFVLALILQGLFGGTLAAANGYLASYLGKQALSQALNWTQFTARLALVLAPIGLGWFIDSIVTEHIQRVYLWLAILPFCGFLLALFLPGDSRTQSAPLKRSKEGNKNSNIHMISLPWLLFLQFLFNFAMVVTFPYFLPYASEWIQQASLVGLLYSLPHVFYLFLLPLLKAVQLDHRHLGSGLLLLIIASTWQIYLDNYIELTAARLLFGLGIFLAYCGLNHLISHAISSQQAGSSFGKLDAAGKWAGVAAGLSAGWLCSDIGFTAPFIASAIVASLSLIMLFFLCIPNKGHRVSHAISR